VHIKDYSMHGDGCEHSRPCDRGHVPPVPYGVGAMLLLYWITLMVKWFSAAKTV